jgi:hypothetical protein
VSKFASIAVRLAVGSALLGSVAFAGAWAQGGSAIPDFSSNRTAWKSANGLDYTMVPGSPPQVTNDPAHPYVSNAEANRTGKQPTYRIANLGNPNIKQWAKDAMKKDNDEVLGGKIAYTPGSSCKPWGVPAVWLSGGPFYFVQTPKMVWIIESGDRLTRRIMMNVPHTANPKPSWYGESVGKYEGDTLVVDTIGMNAKTFVDNYRTPHTEKLHVVERYKLIEGGKRLEVHMTVDDPDTFNQPWQVIRHFDRDESVLDEEICQEGNFMLFDYGIPVADKPDF